MAGAGWAASTASAASDAPWSSAGFSDASVMAHGLHRPMTSDEARMTNQSRIPNAQPPALFQPPFILFYIRLFFICVHLRNLRINLSSATAVSCCLLPLLIADR